jgi:hypothetical protein
MTTTKYQFDFVIEKTPDGVLQALDREQVDGWECMSISPRAHKDYGFEATGRLVEATPVAEYVIFLRRPVP